MRFLSGGQGRAGAGGGGAGWREGYYYPSLTETLWGKGKSTVVVWASLRGDGKVPPFSSVEAMSMVSKGFIIGGESAQQIARLSNINVRNFSQRDHFGFGGGTAHVSLNHRVMAVFLLLTPHAVRGERNKAFGKASLRRTDKVVECFRAVTQEVRTFYAQSTRITLTEPIKKIQEQIRPMFKQKYPGVDGGSIPAGAHAEAGGRDVPGSE